MRASSYIPTEASAVTRAADNVSRVLGDEFNPSEFSLYIEYEISKYATTNFASVIGVSANNYVGIGYNSSTNQNTNIFVSIGGISFSTNLPDSIRTPYGDRVKLIVSFKAGQPYVISSKGLSVHSDVALPDLSSISKMLYLGSRFGTSFLMSGHIKDFKIYPRALSEQEAIELTKV